MKSSGCLNSPDSQPPKLVAVIDDEPVVRVVARTALEFAGYRVIDAPDGERGWSLFQEHGAEIAVVLLDVMMPVVSGAEVLRRMRAGGFSQPVVVCSGYSEHLTREQFRGLSFEGFLPKPFTSPRLIEVIRRVLQP